MSSEFCHEREPFFTTSLPLPPGISQSYKLVRGLRVLVASEALLHFQHTAATNMSQAIIKDYALVEQMRQHEVWTRLSLLLKFYLPSPWKRDLEDMVKAVSTEIFEYLELDYDMVFEQHATKAFDAHNPRVEVQLYRLTSD